MIQSASRFASIFATGSHHLRNINRAAKGKPELPRDIVTEEMTAWGRRSLEILRVDLKVVGKPTTDPVLFLGNHISYLDIPLLASQRPIMFVAKKEVGSWPVFGTAIRKLGMVLVDRDAANSRAQAAEGIARCIRDRKYSVAIFPSGTTTMAEEKPWRWGAFQIAQRYQLPVQPFRLKYEPARRVAYLKEDIFAFHLFKLLGTDRIQATLEFAPVTKIEDPQEDCMKWHDWCRAWFNSA